MNFHKVLIATVDLICMLHFLVIQIFHIYNLYKIIQLQHQDGSVVSLSASHTVGLGFAPPPGHTKEHPKNGTHSMFSMQALGFEIASAT